MPEDIGENQLLTPGEALKVLDRRGLRLGASTLRRYATSGRLRSEALPSGHRRYRRADVVALVSGHQTTETSPDAA
ncbi:MerR family transcriptional regulator [Frankia sp. AgB1.9]|uniref:hypothetical protein n=1 Tax=unclassified Frankia TaxID=2632575 RepID=UPI00193367DB|nr:MULTISPECIES: hypothetical protein [unclassified Frankia]MBL7487351.1 MerR family transcriptional regulator [Frankia sp. AgW1.1]MBL7546359.1 MerR family transcriptional regulator [Frankia sp. AgB1.9]MBL7618596.1 hypothetical protein [Frankia sp. AgB1.8]